MYDRSDKRRIYQLIEMYLSKEIDEIAFCNDFIPFYDVDLDYETLTREEEKAFSALADVASRFSGSEEDMQNYPGIYTDKEEVKQKILQTKEILLPPPLKQRDLRLLRLIQKRVSLFASDRLHLYDLVSELSGLLNTLESLSESWKGSFQTEINGLELIYDSIEDGSISRWIGDFKKDIKESLLQIEKIVSSVIEQYLILSDPNVLETAVEASSGWLMCPTCQEAWETTSIDAMVICPKCDQALHNPTRNKTKAL
ncbi:MAG: hypothetical protein JSR76_01540 [Verrucomicrobia bacterium]|nr:hypothetical protein [Verrucomicrobiota bacterium]